MFVIKHKNQFWLTKARFTDEFPDCVKFSSLRLAILGKALLIESGFSENELQIIEDYGSENERTVG